MNLRRDTLHRNGRDAHRRRAHMPADGGGGADVLYENIHHDNGACCNIP